MSPLAAEQARADGNQCGVFPRAGRERVHVRGIVDRNFRHLDTGLLRLSLYGRNEPGFRRVRRLRDDAGARGALGDPLGHRKRNKRTAEAEYRGKNQQRFVVDAGVLLVEVVVDTQDAEHGAQYDEDRNVGGQEKRNALEHS